jgi:hypothetical protein
MPTRKAACKLIEIADAAEAVHEGRMTLTGMFLTGTSLPSGYPRLSFKSKRVRRPGFDHSCALYGLDAVDYFSVNFPRGTRMHPRVGAASTYVIEMVECQLFICVCHVLFAFGLSKFILRGYRRAPAMVVIGVTAQPRSAPTRRARVDTVSP